MRATRERAARDIVMQVAVRVINLAMGVVVTALVVRTLGSVGYGQWSTILVLVSLLGYFATFGMEGAAMREAARSPEHEFEWLGAVMALRLMIIAPLLIVSLLVMAALAENDQMLIAGFILVGLMPFGGVSTLGLLFQLRVDNRIPMIVMTFRSIIWGVAVLIIYLHHGSIVALAIAMVVTNLASSVVQAWAAVRLAHGWPRPNRRRLHELVRIGVPLGISGVLIISYARIDQVIVFTVAGAHEAGLYGAVYTVLDQAHFVPLSILTTLSPVLAASWPANRERLLNTARLSAELLALASFGALAFVLAAAEPVVTTIFGASFAEAAPALPVLGGAFVLICFGYLNGNLMVVLGQQRRLLWISLLALIVNLAGNAAFVPLFGFMGAAVMTLLTELVVIVCTTTLIRRRLELPAPRPGRIARTALAAALLAALLGGMRVAGVPLAGLIAAACVLYPAFLFALRAVGRDELQVLLRRGETA